LASSDFEAHGDDEDQDEPAVCVIIVVLFILFHKGRLLQVMMIITHTRSGNDENE